MDGELALESVFELFSRGRAIVLSKNGVIVLASAEEVLCIIEEEPRQLAANAIQWTSFIRRGAFARRAEPVAQLAAHQLRCCDSPRFPFAIPFVGRRETIMLQITQL